MRLTHCADLLPVWCVHACGSVPEPGQPQRTNWAERLTAPFKFGGRDLLPPALKLGSAVTVTAMMRRAAGQLGRQLLSHHVRYQVGGGRQPGTVASLPVECAGCPLPWTLPRLALPTHTHTHTVARPSPPPPTHTGGRAGRDQRGRAQRAVAVAAPGGARGGTTGPHVCHAALQRGAGRAVVPGASNVGLAGGGPGQGGCRHRLCPRRARCLHPRAGVRVWVGGWFRLGGGAVCSHAAAHMPSACCRAVVPTQVRLVATQGWTMPADAVSVEAADDADAADSIYHS